MDDIVVFGPGLIKAYSLERRYAVYPRVVVHQDLAEEAHNDVVTFYGGDFAESPQGTYLATASDGVCFLNYLGAVELLGPQAENLERHRGAIADGLDENRARLAAFQKYMWAAHYHNHFCRSVGLEEFLIPQAECEFRFSAFEEWGAPVP
jgi:hypothetical protein